MKIINDPEESGLVETTVDHTFERKGISVTVTNTPAAVMEGELMFEASVALQLKFILSRVYQNLDPGRTHYEVPFDTSDFTEDELEDLRLFREAMEVVAENGVDAALSYAESITPGFRPPTGLQA